MAAVIDRDFLAGLRAVAESTAEALADRASLARDADQYQAAEVADVAANGFRALAELAATRLAGERERLMAAVDTAELAATAADARFSDMDNVVQFSPAGRAIRAPLLVRQKETEMAAAEAWKEVARARAALAEFDTATKGDE